MGEKVPYRTYLSEDVIEALKEAAEKTSGMTHNQVAAEVIAHCLPIWIHAQEAFQDVIDDYFRQVKTEAKSRRKRE